MEWSDYEECNLCKTSQSGQIFSAPGDGVGGLGGAGGGEEGGWHFSDPIMAHTGRLRLKRVPFSSFRYIKR